MDRLSSAQPLACTFATCQGLQVPLEGQQREHQWGSWRLEQTCRRGFGPMASLTSGLLQKRSRPVALFSLARAAQGPPSQSFRIMKMKGDGRCMFRAIAYGLNKNQGQVITDKEIESEADELRLACRDALCRSKERRKQFSDAVYAVETEDTLSGYCQRLTKTDFYGGNVELLVLSKMLRVPLIVYLEDSSGGHGYRPIVKYGEDFRRRPVRLLYTNGNHYDLLV